MPTKPEAPAPAAVPTQTVVDVRELSVHFGLRGGTLAQLAGRSTGTVKAVDGITLQLHRGEVIGLVGESGSGKSTLGRALLGLVPATHGSIEVQGEDVASMSRRRLREIRRDIQMVFQDPNAALNPAMTVEEAVGDALRIHGVKSSTARRARVIEALELVGLSPVELFLPKYPRDLSGGQKQRVVIARAIVMDPSVLVADEPISMLDMSVRAKILQLMLDLKERLDLSYVYITHDLASAKFFCDRIAIMYLGRIVEIGPTDQIFAEPRHPYTRALLQAIPDPDPSLAITRDLPRGEIPDAARPPRGCSFHPRCPVATSTCGWEARDLRTLLEDHWLRQPPEVYAAESALVGSLAHVDAADPTASGARVRIGKGSATEVIALLERIRAERPAEPFWTGVSSIEVAGDAVEIAFHTGVDPALRNAGAVEVACVLYPER